MNPPIINVTNQELATMLTKNKVLVKLHSDGTEWWIDRIQDGPVTPIFHISQAITGEEAAVSRDKFVVVRTELR